MNTDRTTMNGKPVFTVPAKTVINFHSKFDKKLLCDGLTFTAGNACAFSCSFCYVDDMQRKAREWHEKHGVTYPEEGHMGLVIRIQDAVALARKQILSKPEAFRRQRLVIYASAKVDVAGNLELVRETVEICKVILELTNWDIRLLSKSNLLPVVARELVKAANDRKTFSVDATVQRVIYGVSTGTLDDGLAAAFEQGTAKVSKRIESLHWLQDNGFRTFGMLCPSLPLPDADRYDHQSLVMMESIRAERCEHVWAEVINVRGDSMTKTVAALNSAGYGDHARVLEYVSTDKAAWERYARWTFESHRAFCPPGKLRFLQYLNNANRSYWEANADRGAVLL